MLIVTRYVSHPEAFNIMMLCVINLLHATLSSMRTLEVTAQSCKLLHSLAVCCKLTHSVASCGRAVPKALYKFKNVAQKLYYDINIEYIIMKYEDNIFENINIINNEI